MEIEINPGTFLSVITKEQWLRRIEQLSGDDLAHFLSQCNLARAVPDKVFIQKDELLKKCKELEPHFDPETDYYVIRQKPQLDT
jgi:hypothetical protein